MISVGGVVVIGGGGSGGPAIPDPTGAPDGQVVTTSGGAYGLAASGPTRTDLDLSSATGWTVAAGTGTATINTGDETADLSGPAGTEFIGNNAPGVSQPLGVAEEWEVRGRLVDLSGGQSGGARALLEVASIASGETGVSAVSAWVSPSGQIELLTAVGSGFSSRGNVSASLPLGGTGWLRIRRRDGVVSVYHGTGVGTAPPTVWRCTHTVSWAAGDPTVALAHFRVRMLHFGSSYATPVSVRWADLSVVDLGAPA